MTTVLLSALRSEALATLVAYEVEQQEESARKAREEAAGLAATLRDELQRHFGIDATEVDIFQRGAMPACRIDHITFSLVRDDDNRYRYDLAVVLPCTECGKDSLHEIASYGQHALTQLGGYLRDGVRHQYPGCPRPVTESDDDPADASVGDVVDRVAVAIDEVEERAAALGEALADEARLEDERALVKAAAITRLLEAKAATSATAAEKIVEQDSFYATHRQHQRAQIIERMTKWGAYEAAKLRAQRLVAKEGAQ